MSYGATGTLGKSNWMSALFNNHRIIKDIEEYLEGHHPDDTLLEIKAIMETCQKASDALPEDPYLALASILDFYPTYFAALGMMNNLMRYLGDEEEKGILTKETVHVLMGERDKVAKFYPQIEKTIFDCTDIIGQLLGFEGDLMRYMSLPEMDIFLKEKKLGEAQLKILEERKEGYVMVYLEEGDQEIIQTGSIVAEIREMLQPSISTTELKGTCAFPGRAKGRVHNLLTDRNWHPPKGAIIVTTMTNPDDTPIIKNASALITEEGGILSHAAVLSRELMIPCIMSTKYATQMLKTGDIIEVDAEKGIIKKV